MLDKIIDSVLFKIDKLRGKDPQYEADIRTWEKTKIFPCHRYPDRKKWPAPFFGCVPPKEVYGRCPNCGVQLDLDAEPKEFFPKVYTCPFCERQNFPHPLYTRLQLGVRI